MALVVPTVAKTHWLNVLLGNTADEDIYLRLFTNDITPDASTVLGDFTEATGGGYTQKTLAKASASVAAGVATWAESSLSFVAGGPAAVYGYYLVGVDSGSLLGAEVFTDGPYAANVAGTEILVTVKL